MTLTMGGLMLLAVVIFADQRWWRAHTVLILSLWLKTAGGCWCSWRSAVSRHSWRLLLGARR